MKTKFDFSEVENFDEHIHLSIPNYDGLMDVITASFLEFMPPQGVCVDLGCSTGKLIGELSKLTQGEYVGVDEVNIVENRDFTFFHGDCLDYLLNLESCDVIISCFTLQFLGTKKREQVLLQLKELVDNGATLFLAEKTYCNSPKINTILWREHIRQKRKSFTDTQILDKDYDLFGSMFCKTDSEIKDELSSLGKATQIWQSYNFKCWIITN